MSLPSELAGAIEDPAASPRSAEITIGQRMLAACSGSLITSFAVTPFDVVRIRIHQQELMNDCCHEHSTGSRKVLKSGGEASGQMVQKPGKTGQFPKMGGVPTQLAKSSVPNQLAIEKSMGVFWNTQQFCETARDCPKITSTFQGMMSIARNEGMVTLWRGLSLTLLMAVPSNIIYFTGYEYIKELSPINDAAVNPLVCGSLARMMSATVVSPIELLKTRFQSVPNSVSDGKHKIFKSLLRDSAASFRKNGYGSMFTGLQITLWRDVPFSGIYWMCYEHFKARFSRALDVDFSRPAQDDWKIFCASFLSGSLGGVVAAFFTNPFDVGKTRLQIASPESKSARPSMFRFLWRIRTEEGVGALYKGFAPRVMKIAPSCAIMISSYEYGKKLFQQGL